jgi:hypothetical protein
MADAVGFHTEDLKHATTTDWKRLVGTAQCWRCGGLLVIAHCLDLLDDTGQLDFKALRCVQCGEVVDPIILYNRQVGPEGIHGARRRRLSPARVSSYSRKDGD